MPEEPIDLKSVAHLARLELTTDELETFSNQLGRVIDHIRQLERVNIAGVEPTAHANPVYDIKRDDTPRPGLTTEQALENAPRSANSLFIVPKVLD